MIEQWGSDWMQWQVRGIIFSALVLVVAMPFHWRSPIWRHWVFVSGTLVLLALPLLVLMLPSWNIDILPREIVLDPFSAPVLMTASEQAGSPLAIALFVVSIGLSIALLTHHLRQFLSLRKVLIHTQAPDTQTQALFDRCAVELDLIERVKSGGLRLEHISTNIAPFTIGWRNAKIVLPQALAEGSDTDKYIVLIHELQHVKRRDWLWQQCIVLALLLYPLNPLVWVMKKRARALAEESVDKLSLGCGVSPTTYADTLLRQLRQCRSSNTSIAVNMSQRIDILERVESLIAEPYAWVRPSPLATLTVGVMMLMMSWPIATLHVGHREPHGVSLTSDVSFFQNLEVEHIKVEPPEDIQSQPNTSNSGKSTPTPQVLTSLHAPPKAVFQGVAPTLEDARPIQAIAPTSVEPMTIGSVVIPVEPRPVFLSKPSYPERERRNGREAVVEVVFDLDTTGAVANPRIKHASIEGRERAAPRFEKAALQAIQASRYKMTDPYARPLITRDLSQTYIFQLVEDRRQTAEENQRQNPP